MNLTHYQLSLLSALETQRIRLSASLAPEAYAELKFLEKAGFVKIVPPDPNFSYLPDYNASDLFFALASPGWQALHLEQDRRQHEIEESLFHWSFDIHISRPVAVIAITCLIWGAVDVYALSIGYFAYWCLLQLRGILFCILDKIVNRS